MAPEVIDKKKSPKGDIWSIGAITYWLLTGKEPLNVNTKDDFDKDLKKLKDAKVYKFDSEFEGKFSKDAVGFV